jgi:hypothetical protein
MPHFFGLGPGYLPQKYARIARKHGANLVNYTDAECNCGYGCRPHTCPASRRHWFERNRSYGFPLDNDYEREVMDALAAAGLEDE